MTIALVGIVFTACSRTEEPAVVTLPERATTTSIPTVLAPENPDRDDLPTEPLEIAWVIQVGGPGDDEFHGITATGSIGGESEETEGSAPQNVVAVGSSTAELTLPHPEAADDEPKDEPESEDDPSEPTITEPPGTSAPPTTTPTTTTVPPPPSDPGPTDDPTEPRPDPSGPPLGKDHRVLVSRLSATGEALRSDIVESRGPAVATSAATVRAPGATGEAASLPIGCGFSMGDLIGLPLGSSDGWCGPVATTLGDPDSPDDLARVFGFGFTAFAADSNESISGIATTAPDDDPDLAARQNMFLAGYTDGVFPGAGDSAGRGLGQGDALTFRTSLRDGTTWIRQFGTPFADAATDVCTTDGHGYFVGWTDGDLAGTSAGGRDTWISMIDSMGMQRWLIQFGYAADEEFRSVACTGVPADGTQQFIAVGTTNGNGPKDSSGGIDALIASFAPDGSTLWASQFGGSGDDRATAVVVADDVIYVAGTSSSPSEPAEDEERTDDETSAEEHDGSETVAIPFGVLDDTIGSGGRSDGFLTALDATTGTILWTTRFGSDGDEEVTSATITNEGLLVLAGSTTGGLGDHLSAGGKDGFVIAFELPSAGGGGAQSWV